MNYPIKEESIEMSTPIKRAPTKKDKVGRWSTAESYLFESLLERYGKNWKKIQEHMKNRTLSQIRSHAQKFFDKIGDKKVEQYERRAKLLEAYETLEKEKRLREEAQNAEVSDQNKSEQLVKQEEESPLTGAEVGENVTPIREPVIKEQKKQIENQKMVQQKNTSKVSFYPFLQENGGEGVECGFLIQLLKKNRQMFYQHQGIQPFVDNAGFNSFYSVNRQ